MRKKAKSNKRVADQSPQAVTCPVIPIALRVGELWDAHAAAQTREFNTPNRVDLKHASEQIELMRIAVEETASFERAQSLAGALFQAGLAHDAATHLYELVASEELAVKMTFCKLIRLLDSVAVLLREKCPAQDYQTIKDVLGVYLAGDRPEFHASFQWREDIPELAKEYRRSEMATA
jgi:hypothetical protein